MKKLTDSQKKWALTACLATVLSFNMVLSLAKQSPGSANFASSEPRFESLISNKGETLKVKYMQDEDGKTLAIVPEKLESGLCYNCGTKYLLPKGFDSSATDLEAALRKAMYETKEISKSEGEDLDQKAPKKVTEKKRTPRARDEDAEESKEENADFAALIEKCDKRSEESQLRCYASGLTKLLKDKKKNFDRDEVMSFFREHVEPGLRAGLADVSDLMPKRASRYGNEMEDKGESRRQETQTLVEEMISQISKKHNYLRQRLTMIAAKSVLSNQESAQMKLKQAEQIRTSDPQAAMRLQTEGYARLRAANQVANDIGGSLYDGLESAQWSNYINQDQFDSFYYEGYANTVSQAIRGMTSNPLTYVIPSVTLTDGTTIVDQNGQSFTVTPSKNPIAQQGRANSRGITVMTNNLTPADIVNSSTPRIATLNGAQAQQGTATIQMFRGTSAPVNATSGSIVPLRGR